MVKISEDGPVELTEVNYPEPEMEAYSFSEKPLSVYTHDFDITSKAGQGTTIRVMWNV